MEKEILHKSFQGAMEKILDEAKVPFKVHKAIIDKLHEAISNHQQEMDAHSQSIKQFKSSIDSHANAIRSYQSDIAHVRSLAKGEQGIPGRPGQSAPPVDLNSIVRMVRPLIRKPKDGEPGKPGTPGKPGKDAIFDKETLITEIVDAIKKKKLLDVSNLRNAESFMYKGTKYGVHEMMHGGSSGSSTTTTNYVETPTGLINGSNTVYTTAHTITTVLGMWINGQFIHPSEYTVSGAGFTMSTALDASLSGTGFTISYIQTT